MSSQPRRIAVFPGQFDPMTNGHLDLVRRASALFDHLIVAVGVNPDKRGLFSLPERVEMATRLVADISNVSVQSYEGLTVDLVRRVGAAAIVRGIRDSVDLRYEIQLALANRAVGGVETVFMMTVDQFALTSSSLIRQIVSLGGDLAKLEPWVPPVVLSALRRKQRAGAVLRSASPDAPTT